MVRTSAMIAFDHGYSDATTRIMEDREAAMEEALARGIDPKPFDYTRYRGDWTSALISATTEKQRKFLHLAGPRGLAEYQRGCLAGVTAMEIE